MIKSLVFDIETAPMLAHVWGRHDQQIGLNQIDRDWSVLAWGAKWLNDPPSKVFYRDTSCNKDVRQDKNILETLWPLLDQANIVITQNGKNFDAKKINARFMLHGMKPPSPYKHIDTYKNISQIASFTSNSLEYLTDKLCTKYKKLTHKKYPGMSLWTECLKGNREAWDEMRRYNIHDVLSTEELYLKTRAWFPASTPEAFLSTDRKCGVCGKNSKTKQGIVRTRQGIYQQYKCKDCGRWSKGEKLS